MPNFSTRLAKADGILYHYSSVSIAASRMGPATPWSSARSPTARFPSNERWDWVWWTSGNNADTLANTLYPINPQKKINQGYTNTGLLGINTSVMYQGFSSNHPGGINAAFCDGSVKFLKDTIDTMPYDASTGLPVGVTADANGILQFPPGQRGVWQSISTRNGGEVISADSY